MAITKKPQIHIRIWMWPKNRQQTIASCLKCLICANEWIWSKAIGVDAVAFFFSSSTKSHMASDVDTKEWLQIKEIDITLNAHSKEKKTKKFYILFINCDCFLKFFWRLFYFYRSICYLILAMQLLQPEFIYFYDECAKNDVIFDVCCK